MEPDEPAKPTEDQVKAANEAEMARWEGDFPEEDLTIPYKQEDAVEEKQPIDKSKGVEDDDGGDKSGDGAGDVEEAEQYSTPEPVVTVEDPGEYKAADHSFEVTLKDGKTVKISTPEDAEKLADDPENFETPKQLMDFINKQNKMNRSLEKDYEKWESQHKTFEDQTAEAEKRQENVENIVKGFTYLIKKGKLPAVADEYLNADWSDPEIAKQTGVKEQVELLNYMTKENKDRESAGLPPFATVVDAYNAWMDDEKVKQKSEAERAAGEARKTASARVAGVSPAQQGTYVPKGIAVGRVLPQRSAAVWDD